MLGIYANLNNTQARESELIDLIEETLPRLRMMYLNNKEEFSDETITFLQTAGGIPDALRDLMDAVDDKSWVQTYDDAAELIVRLEEIRARLVPFPVAKRAEKEIRELLAQLTSLPSIGTVRREREHTRRVVQLEAKASLCPKCNTKMTLRGSHAGLFWGCGDFPRCFYRQWLTKQESKALLFK